ncbi:MAG: CHASE2 domain-containing protein [Candidatus Wallbacteria bacterium]|nr:CHASE2 domain-containing protein [Candidatus Wallbacteria bacterium]
MALVGVASFFVGRVPAVARLDDQLFDGFARLQTVAGDPGGAVIVTIDEPALLEEGDWPWKPDRLAQLLEGVFAARPSVVGLSPGLTSVLLAASPQKLAQLQQARGSTPLVLSLRPAPELPESLPARAKALAAFHDDWGVWTHESDDDGILRRLHAEVPAEVPPGSLFEHRVARHLGVAAAVPTRIRFTGAARSLPYVSLLRLARREMPASVLSGRPALVGLSAGSATRSFPTPTTGHGRPMPEVEVAAHALHTLVAGYGLVDAGLPMRLGAHLAMGVAFFNLCRWFSVVSSYILLALSIVGTVSSSLLLALYAGLLLPVTPLLALDLGLFALVLRYKLQDQDQRLRAVLLRFTGGVSGGGAAARAGWKEALVTMGQYVDCRASALLSAREKGELPVVEASSGLPKDEEEQIASALVRFEGAEITRLEGVLRGREVVVVPLFLGKRLLGYWAFVLGQSSSLELRGPRARTLTAVAREFAVREFERQLVTGGARSEARPIAQRLFHDPRDRELEDLSTLTDETARERDYLRDVFERLEVGVLTGNLLGEVTTVNSAFARAVSRSRDEAARANFFDLAGAIFTREGTTVRDCLDRLFDTGRVLQEEFSPAGSRAAYFVSWSVLREETAQAPVVKGYLCTALDVSRHRALDQLRTHMLEAVTLKVRNILSVVLGYAEDFTDFRGTVDEAAETGRIVYRSASQLSELFEDFQRVSQFGLTSDRLQRVPLDMLAGVRGAVENSQDFASQKGCTVKLEEGVPPDPVRGDPAFLSRSVEALLYQSLLNAPSGGSVVLRVRQEEGRVAVEIRGEGFGLPQDAVARFFEEPADESGLSSVWQSAGQLLPHQVHRALADMDGGVELSSRVGEGTTFRLWLPLL